MLEAILESYLFAVLTDIYFHRHLAATFFGVVAGFLLSLALQRRHEAKSNRHTRDMYLLALQVELKHNRHLLKELQAINTNTASRNPDFYEPANQRLFYSMLEGVVKSIRFNVFNGIMANGMLGFFDERLTTAFLDSYRRLDHLVLEVQTSPAWLTQMPGETADLWLERKKGILEYFGTITTEALASTEHTLRLITAALPEKLSNGGAPSLRPKPPHTEITAD